MCSQFAAGRIAAHAPFRLGPLGLGSIPWCRWPYGASRVLPWASWAGFCVTASRLRALVCVGHTITRYSVPLVVFAPDAAPRRSPSCYTVRLRLGDPLPSEVGPTFGPGSSGRQAWRTPWILPLQAPGFGLTLDRPPRGTEPPRSRPSQGGSASRPCTTGTARWCLLGSRRLLAPERVKSGP